MSNKPVKGALAVELRSLDANQRQQRLVTVIRDEAAKVLKVAVSSLAIERPLRDQGMDSLEAVLLSVELGDLLGWDLPETLGLDYPTVEALAAHLAGAVDEHAPAPKVAPAPAAAGEPPTEKLDELSAEELAALVNAEVNKLS
jgi:acyl carrier protein